MEGETFDDLVKRLTEARLTRLDALRGVLASAAVGLAGATLSAEETAAKKQGKGKGKKKRKHRKGKGQGQAERQPKVTLCHKPGTPDEKTKEVPPPAVDAHLGHGDTLGPCAPPRRRPRSRRPPRRKHRRRPRPVRRPLRRRPRTTTTAAPTTTTTVAPTTTTTPLACRANGRACTEAGQCCSSNCFNSVCAAFVTSCGSSTCGPNTRGCAGNTCCGPPAFFSCVAADISQCCGPPATHCEGGRCVA